MSLSGEGNISVVLPGKGEQEHGALRRGVHEPFSVHSAIDFNRQSNVSVMDMHAHHTHTQLHTY